MRYVLLALALVGCSSAATGPKEQNPCGQVVPSGFLCVCTTTACSIQPKQSNSPPDD